MNFLYFIASLGILSVFSLCYHFLFKKDTFLNLKRGLLLFIMLYACIFPWVTTNIDSFLHSETINDILTTIHTINLEEIMITTNNDSTTDNIQAVNNYVLILWISISCILLIRLLLQVISVWKLKQRSQVYTYTNQTLFNINQNLSPFSFFNWIFINRSKYSEENFQRILQHELVHMNQLHSFDILFTELFCAVFWWNPLAWLIKKEVKINLEFLADRKIIAKEKDIKRYQYLLFEETTKNNLQVVNNFNITELKKRIIMMNKVKTNNLMLLKYVVTVPMLACSLLVISWSCSNAEVSNPSTEAEVAKEKIKVEDNIDASTSSSSSVIEEVFEYCETMPQYPGGDNAMYQFVSKNLQYPQEAQDKKIQGRVIVRFIVSKTGKIENAEVLRGIDPMLDQAALDVVNRFPNWNPGKQDGKAISVYFTLPIVFKLTK